MSGAAPAAMGAGTGTAAERMRLGAIKARRVGMVGNCIAEFCVEG